MKRSLGKTFGNLDTAWDQFLSMVMDEDLADSAKRLFGKVGHEVGKAGIKIAREGMIGFHRMTKAAHDALQGSSAWSEESEWNEE
jgi:predicted hydrocarbon binding protein